MNIQNWSNFYTPETIANQIVSMIPNDFRPNVAIDICVGSGNFLDAATKHWQNIKAIGVDICLNNITHKEKYILHQIDALNTEHLIDNIIKNDKKPKVILANPPFGKLENSEKYLNSDNEYDLIHNEAIETKRIEALMLVSNLKLLKKGDYFGAILPENFFTSIRLSKFKKRFMNHFTDVIIGGKEKYFDKTDVKTRVFIGKYIGNKGLKNEKCLSKKKNYSDFNLYRGLDNSKLLLAKKNGDRHVIHFSNLNGIQKLKRFYSNNEELQRLIVCENDTLILRVGRSAGHSFKAKKEYLDKYVSDYFYLLKGVSFTNKEHKILQSILKNKRNGLAANYINKGDIIESINVVLEMRQAS